MSDREPAPGSTQTSVPHLLIAGGGYVGLYVAYGLRHAIKAGKIRVTVVDARSTMTYQPFMAETAGGSIEPRHAVVSTRKVLSDSEVVTARVTRIRHADRTVEVQPEEGDGYEIGYDSLVVAIGSVSKTLPIPGLSDFAVGFKHLEEAIALRNTVLDRLDVAASTTETDVRRRALTFVFVGGGYAGTEGFAELQDMAAYAMRYYPQLVGQQMRWVLVEAGPRILAEVSPSLSRYTMRELHRHGMEVLVNTQLKSCVDGHVELSDGQRFEADTVVWTAGVKSNPELGNTDLPRDDKGRLPCTPDLRVAGVDGVWAAGDNAAVPDLSGPPGSFCGPTAQHAVRQARRMASNIEAELDGRPTKPYKHMNAGSVASLGLYRGVAEIYHIRMRGIIAWIMHRTYHLSRVPTLNRKVRVAADWALALFFRREVVSLGSLQRPTEEFRRPPPVGKDETGAA